MNMNADPIADMLTRIRNANALRYDTVSMPYSKMKDDIAKILKDQGYIVDMSIDGEGAQKNLTLTLKYGPSGEHVISGLKRISKPGLRVTVQADKLPRVLRGLRDRHHFYLERIDVGCPGEKSSPRRRSHLLRLVKKRRREFMSRIGFKPISLPSGVTVTINGSSATVKGAKGEVSVLIPSDVSVEVKDGKAQVKIINTEDARQGNENEGTVAANLKNAIHGVSTGWKKELEIAGTGYRADERQSGQHVLGLFPRNPRRADRPIHQTQRS
jgi:small subunit ribosomal protein S8